MALTLDDLIESVRESRRHFLKHVEGLREDQWDWQPYPQCKSVRETLLHLIGDDRAARWSLETGQLPDWETLYNEPERDATRLCALLGETHEALIAFLKTHYADTPLDAEVALWGQPTKLGRAVAYLTAEDFYHGGQVAFIRMASDPAWDYYAAIYGIATSGSESGV